jgi:hypothetical protein
MAYIHLADAGVNIGTVVSVPDTRKQSLDLGAGERKPLHLPITAADTVGGKTIVALGSVEHQFDADEPVVLWDADQKMAHTRCGLRCRKEHDHQSEMIPAGFLPGHEGRYIFHPTEFGIGPHRIIRVHDTGHTVEVTLSVDELIGDVAANLKVA